jgi:hypothetical protein
MSENDTQKITPRTTETYTRPCPYCEQMVPICRDIRLDLPDDFARPATDCDMCGYAALPRRLWPVEWR